MPPQNIPQQIKKLAFSPQIYKETERIGKLFGLHIDQIGELDAEITDIFLGKNKSSDFVDHIITRLEINKDTANKITTEVNKNIFQAIKSSLQSTNPDLSNVSDLEAAGNFTVEPEQGSNTVDQSTHSLESHEEIITNIENPVPAQPRATGTSTNEGHVETMLVDHLLSGPMVSIEKKTVIDDQEPPVPHKPKPITPKRPSGPDLYREQI